MTYQPQDDALTKLEEELRVSRSQAWDVEKYLAARHQAKIDALTASHGNRWLRGWEVAKGLAAAAAFVIGYLTIFALAGAWLLEGEFPIHRGILDHDRAYHALTENPVVAPALPANYRVGQVPIAAPIPAPS